MTARPAGMIPRGAPVLETRGIGRAFGALRAVADVSLTVGGASYARSSARTALARPHCSI